MKRFRLAVIIYRTRSFLAADIGSDHDLVMVTVRVRLEKAEKPNQPRLRVKGHRYWMHFSSNNKRKISTFVGPKDKDMGINTMDTTY